MKTKLLLLLFLIPFYVKAATSWVGPATITTAAWNTASNWSPSGIPTSSEAITFTTAVTITQSIPSSSSNQITITNTGSVTVASGNTVTFGDIDVKSGVLVNDGTLNSHNIDFPVAGGTITNNGTMNANNLNVGSGTLSGAFNNNGSLKVNQDIVVFEGTFNNNTGATFIANGFDIKDGGNIVNSGTFTSLGNSSTAQGTIALSASFINNANSTLNLNILIGNVFAMNVSGIFTNAGTVNVGKSPFNPNSRGIRVTTTGTLTNSNLMVFTIDPANCVIVNNGTLNTVAVSIVSGMNCLNTPIALPVYLKSFVVEKSGCDNAAIKWSTAMEQNMQLFVVEHSRNGKEYINIGEILANGNSQTERAYMFIAPLTGTGVNYYRLKMIDLNGDYKYSPVKNIYYDAPSNTVTLVPNLTVTGYTVLNLQQPLKKNATIGIWNGTGQLVRKYILKSGATNCNIDLNNAPKGFYQIGIDGEDMHQVMKLVIQ